MAYTANDAFCAQADVEARLQRGTFTGSTTPTAQHVLDVMARRGAQIEARLADAGAPWTVPSGSRAFAASPSDPVERRLKVKCEDANVLGASADVLQMWLAKAGSDSTNEQVVALLELYKVALDEITREAESLYGSAAGVADAFVNSETVDLVFDEETEF
jgi:hypothetical protein